MLRIGHAAEGDEVGRIPLMSRRVVGTEFEGESELAFSFGEIPLPEGAHKADGRVGLA